MKSDGTWSYTWEHGKHLKSMTGDGKTVSFTYDADGNRVKKTVNGKDTEYYYQGERLIEVKQGSSWLHYNYDSVGPVSAKYVDTIYYFLRNAQGDVLGIVDNWGKEVVRYRYDAWGNLLETSGNMADTLGKLNVLRYRGYCYDDETGLYYLKARYYNPAWGRFISADRYISTGAGMLGSNMFAYCNNNPVMLSDLGGNRPVNNQIRDYGNGLVAYTDTGTGKGKPINGQGLEPYANMQYGNSTIGRAGCEAIACYNAMLLLNKPESFEHVKSFFTSRFSDTLLGGFGVGGFLGGTPKDVSCFLKSRNITYEASGNLQVLEKKANVPDVFIVSFWNKKLYEGYHTIAIDYDGNSYTAYNLYNEGSDPEDRANIRKYMDNDWRYIYGFFVPYS